VAIEEKIVILEQFKTNKYLKDSYLFLSSQSFPKGRGLKNVTYYLNGPSSLNYLTFSQTDFGKEHF